MSSDEITQISIGGIRVGIVGLKYAIARAKPLHGHPDDEIGRILLSQLRVNNYIPAKAEEDYQRAFIREFKRAMGEKVEEDRSGLSIKILGPGCPSCQNLEQMVITVLAELGLSADVEHVTDRKEILSLGIYGTPALIINDKVKAHGTIPTTEMLKRWLKE